MKIPKLAHFNARNLAYVNVGKRKVYLGKWGDPETARKYAEFIDRLINGEVVGEENSVVTLADLAATFMEERKDYYVGTQLGRFKLALEVPLRLYADLPVDEFGPTKLQTCRQQMIDSNRFARTYLNTLVNCIRHVFKFGVERELVKPETLLALQSVSAIKRGRTTLREAQPVKPVSANDVDATLAILTPTLAAMVTVQRYTGMRPAEVCIMRGADLDRTVQPWIYTLSHDKTDYRRNVGDKRTIPIGERAQKAIEPFLTNGYLFTPLNAQEERAQILREYRTTPETKQTRERDARTRRSYGERYTTQSYGRAIARACEQAGVPRWSPNQLRHLFATEVRAQFGLEAAQVMLGHAHADVTQIYAERNFEKAREIAAKIG